MVKKTNKKAIIGIVPAFDEGRYHFDDGVPRVFLRRDYLETLSNVGAVPIILNPEMLTDEIIELCDGIVLSGGGDIDPSEYGEERVPSDLQPIASSERYKWESELISACDESEVPILGVCYGMQKLNVYYGGDLMQDIDSVYGSESVGHFNTDHQVTFLENFLGLSAGETTAVASRHHQAVGRIADGFTPVASTSDGVVEAFYGRGNRYGVQWHPESDMTGVRIYRAFVEICMNK